MHLRLSKVRHFKPLENVHISNGLPQNARRISGSFFEYSPKKFFGPRLPAKARGSACRQEISTEVQTR